MMSEKGHDKWLSKVIAFDKSTITYRPVSNVQELQNTTSSLSFSADLHWNSLGVGQPV